MRARLPDRKAEPAGDDHPLHLRRAFPDLEELRRRLTKRGTETEEQIEVRLQTAAREMELWRDYRYTIISRSVEEDLLKFRHIMGAERYLSSRMVLA